jgi:NAD(P)-dependent dehydrogenase (short-subunit alcohol dehydrogenase family)
VRRRRPGDGDDPGAAVLIGRAEAEPPDLRFDGRVAWIIGASKGLGRAIALAFAGAGADLVLSARSAAALEEVAAAARERGARVELAPGSVTSEEDVAAAAATIERSFGRLDVLVNNAGISPYFVRAERLEPAQLREVLETNLVGAFACCRAALPLLERSPAASIVNVSSIHGSRAHARMLAYAASKGGLEMVTRTLAEEWAGKGIRVNSLAPGYIETEMTEGLRAHDGWREELLGRTPLGRFASPAEIAACAMFLAGPISAYVTGTTLFADGGWSAR